jgi:hypothetical protein
MLNPFAEHAQFGIAMLLTAVAVTSKLAAGRRPLERQQEGRGAAGFRSSLPSSKMRPSGPTRRRSP